MARPAHLILAATLAASTALVLLTFSGSSSSGEANATAPATATCAASIDDWMISSSWPAEEILLGDQLYSRARLFNLASSRGNAVADLALAMAAAQLNLAAGAEPSSDVLEALFQADAWLLDDHTTSQRSQQNNSEIRSLVSTLADFNDWAAAASTCAPSGGALASN